MIESKKINVFILTGFLGAGKTTMLNELLRQFDVEKNIVIENEFGKVNIDAQLVTAKFETIYELTNGCICCSLDEELYDVLSEIAFKRDKVDNIFIETTGIADAGNIATIFKLTQVAEIFDLKKVICVADCQSLEDQLADAIEPMRQFIAADLIVLNKTALVSEHYLHDLNNTVAAINPFAHIVKSETGHIEKEVLFTENHKSKEVLEKEISRNNTHKINNVLYESNEVFDYNALYHALKVTLMLFYNQVFRIKGFVKCINTANNNTIAKIYEVQSTGNTLTITGIEKKNFVKNQLVVIGRELKTETVKRILKAAVLKNELESDKIVV